jgi:hypothetical protein
MSVLQCALIAITTQENLMDLSEFSAICYRFWNQQFEMVQWLVDRKQVASDGTLLFPTIMICTVTEKHLLVELSGASQRFSKLVLKERKQNSTTEYLGQFADDGPIDPMFVLSASGGEFSRLCLSNDIDFEKAEKRFPALSSYKSRLIRTNSNSSLIDFGDGFKDHAFSDCIFLNRRAEIYRVKHVVDLFIVDRNMSASDLASRLSNRVYGKPNPVGTITVESGSEAENRLIATQLQSLYLSPHLHETTIGEFFNRHPEIIARAFNASRFIYEPHLLWFEAAEENPDTAINPDLFFQRSDGFYDILDFKTALLDRGSTTRGPRNRRMFIAAVNEGLAQLANYAEYFNFEKNRLLALSKYGIQIDRPNLYLIVGNFDNTAAVEVEEAMRPFGKNIIVLDYDTVVQLYLKSPD